MNYFHNGYIVLRNTTVLEAQKTIVDFPRRYHNYCRTGLDGRWKCKLLESKDSIIQLQLIDRNFEIPRDLKNLSETPVFHISLEQADSDVILFFRYRQQKLVLILTVFFTLAMLSSWFLTLYLLKYADYKMKAAFPLSIAAFLLSLEIIWLKVSGKHDHLANLVFIELLRKNFDIAES